MPFEAKKYHAHARECLQQTEKADEPKTREKLLELSRVWLGSDGVVDLWGFTSSEAERKAIRVAAESTSGVCTVNDNLVVRRTHGWR